jgi:phage terminase large subunit-like protein
VPFDRAKADAACSFFSRYLRHTKGRFAGTPFLLEEWQSEQIIGPVFGEVDDAGFRRHRLIFVEIPRKNGKSEMAAGVALKLLMADNEPSAEVYSAASDREQAGIVYDVAAQMVRQHPTLRARVKITDSRRNIAVPKTASRYRVVSADGGRQHGLNPSGLIFDEVHTQRRRALWDAMTMGSDTRVQPLTFAITTAGVPDDAPVWWDLHEYARQVREGIFRDDTFLSVHFGAEPGDDFDDPAVWKKANPALGTFLDFEKFKANWARARRIPGEWNEWLRYRLNVPTQQADRWLSIADWDACGELTNWDALNRQRCYAGLDLSTRRDITALVLAFPCEDGRIRLRPFFWLPEANLPSRLRPWVQDGLIELTPGNAVDFAFVRARVSELAKQYQIESIGFDPWNAAQLSTELASDGMQMIEWRFGLRTMSGPSKEFEAAVAEGSMRHDGNPVLRWMADCVSIRSDASGNIIPVKPDRLKSEKRIDGIVAAIIARGLSVSTTQDAPPVLLGAV